MDDLVQFLRARLNEDKVQQQGMNNWHASECDSLPTSRSCCGSDDCDCADYDTGPCDCAIPARVLADVEAKRQVLAEHEQADRYSRTTWGQSNADQARARTLGKVVRLLALPYADHPDYRPDWKP